MFNGFFVTPPPPPRLPQIMALPEEGKHTFFKVRKSEIFKFLGSLRYRKSRKLNFIIEVGQPSSITEHTVFVQL
jgi:hypothetical protein